MWLHRQLQHTLPAKFPLLPSPREQRWAWTGSGLDILRDTCGFFGPGLDLDTYFWKKLDQDRIRILVWFQGNFPESGSKCHKWWCDGSVSFAIVFIFTKKTKLFCQYVPHSSQSMIILVTLPYIFSCEVEVVSCSCNAGMMLCLLHWVAYLFICLWADTKSIVWTHTLCRTQVDKNRQYRT